MSANIRPLEYSEEILSKRIGWVNLKNIQGIKNIEFKVPPSGVIRFNASSETGKSSAFRPFEALVTDKYNTKREIESLVTKGASYGEILVRLYNGVFIGLHLDCDKISNSFYMIQRPDGTREKLQYPNGMHVVLEELGWHTTGTNKLDFSMNVRLKGVLPIVDTPKRLNTELFGIALNDSVLESTYYSLKDSCKESENVVGDCAQQLANINYSLNQIKVEDETVLETELEMLTELDRLDTYGNELENLLTNVHVQLGRRPAHVVAPKYVKPLLEEVDVLLKLESNLSTICTLQRPEHFSVDKGVSTTISTLTMLDSMLTNLEIIHKSVTPEHFVVDREIQSEITKLTYAERLMTPLSTLQTLDKIDKPSATHRNINSELHQLIAIDRLTKSVESVLDIVSQRVPNKSKLNACDKLLHTLDYLVNIISVGEETQAVLESTRLEKSKYQCPTCGQYAESFHTHN